jgi:hypothetical protein
VNKVLKNHPGRTVTLFHISKTFCTAYMILATVHIIAFGFQTCGINPLNSNIIRNHLSLTCATTAKEPVPKQITFFEADIVRKD